MNCNGTGCPLRDTCRRFTNPVKGESFYKVPPFWSNECDFHAKDETAEERIEARNEELRERFKNQLS